MTYVKPPFFVRKVFNPLAMTFGLGAGGTLITRGRRTGEPAKVPVIPVELDGSRYLVSTRGESEWVRNLRAAGGAGELKRNGVTVSFTATEVPPADRPPIIAAYREKAGKAVEAYWKALPDAADHPTFKIEPHVGA